MHQHQSSQQLRRGRLLSFKIWHLLLLILLAAFGAYYVSIVGTESALFVIKKASVSYDEQWNKSWATLDCIIKKPDHLAGERYECFIEVEDKFTFGEYNEGDELRFRFQHKQFFGKPIADPRILVMSEFFGLKVLPSKYSDGIYIVVGMDKEADSEH